MSDPDLRILVAAFDAATRNLEACRLLLERVLDNLAPFHPNDIDLDDLDERTCHHPDALTVRTMGNGDTYLCPDCGEQFW